MSQKMQQLLDLIVNEEMDKADELFHEIVVEKSREIYENLIAEEAEEEMDEATEEEADESVEEDTDESVEEGFGGPEDGETSSEIGGDATDDMVGDVGADDEGGDEFGGDDMGGDGSAPATRDDVQDLEDALAELKAEFEALMGGSTGDEGGEDEFGGEEEDDGEEAPFGGEDDGEEADDEEADDEEDFEESMGVVREYRETVGKPNNSEPAGTNTKSVGLQNPKGRPTTTASAHNILGQKGGEAGIKGGEGLVGRVKGEFTKGVEKNISSSSKSSMKSGSATTNNTAGHGPEKKGAAEGPTNSRSVTDRRQ